jgi:hypothetical protein
MLAESLTHVPAERGADVAIMDADPNATAYRWATTVREGTPIQSHAEADAKLLAVLLPTLREKHATLILDTSASAFRQRRWPSPQQTWCWCR